MSNLIPNFRGTIFREEPLAPYTTWRIGGPAEFLLEPRDTVDLLRACTFAAERGIPLQVLGNGSNVLIDDDGLEGFVVRLRWGSANCCIVDGVMHATAGMMLPALAGRAAHAGYAGLEFLCAVPGTLGGAIAGNAGRGKAHGIAMQHVLQSVEVWDPLLRVVRTATVPELGFSFRRSRVPEHGWIVLSAEIRLPERDEPTAIFARHRQVIAGRQGKFPQHCATAGSVFRLAPEHVDEERTAGWFIERAGLKGIRIGDVVVSPVHANWIINEGHASAADVRSLMALIIDTVYREFGVRLMPEVKVLAGSRQLVAA